MLRDALRRLEEALILKEGEEPVDMGGGEAPPPDLGPPPDFGAPPAFGGGGFGAPPGGGSSVSVAAEKPKEDDPAVPEDATLEDLIDALSDIVDDLEAIAGGIERLNIKPRDVMAARTYLNKAITDLERVAGTYGLEDDEAAGAPSGGEDVDVPDFFDTDIGPDSVGEPIPIQTPAAVDVPVSTPEPVEMEPIPEA